MEPPERPIKEIVKEYNDIIFFLLQVLKTKAKKTNDDIKSMHASRLLKRVNLLISISERELIKLAYQKVISFKTQIVQRDESFFMTKTLDDLSVKLTNPIEGLDDILESVKIEYTKCSQQEKDILYEKVKLLLKCCIEYALTTQPST